MTHDFHDRVMTPAITITSPARGTKILGREKPSNRALLALINHYVLLGRVDCRKNQSLNKLLLEIEAIRKESVLILNIIG